MYGDGAGRRGDFALMIKMVLIIVVLLQGIS